ncbi:glycosyltransferase family 39 protein [Solirubrobacter sp. CPCC 204708]|uniref:Glycosyltransferase family 39 protein n=1 Tax=Solirubrobacter deserti TaxID=2282478 RepID=A0ABT4RUC5_9ACTN|nr:glycosyltransferase family 39 protein [Solirubrobacter deserti]MBE2314762.1 glycosyltransferase family 39 protein [Solirubrobacter deserti]MDA0142178.1 glycosyltransferase family 39 protein [Solirubrobacter deserti]
MRRRLPFILLALVCALSFGLNARMAADPRDDYQSADERSYGKLAVDIADNGHYGGRATNMREPLHWPPGAPMLFAVTYKLFGSDADREDYDIGAVYWSQALVTTGTTLMVFLLAWLLVGPWAGAIAGLIVATYAPLIGATGDQLSEPLGAFLLVTAFTVLALAIKRDRRLWLYAAAGALFGLTILTRTDLLPVPFLIAGAMVAVAVVRRRQIKATTLRYGLVAVTAGVVLAPWTIYASAEEGRLIPVTKGSAAALFVGTYLPGGGTTMGMKTHLEEELRRRHPEYAGMKTYKIPAADALQIFAERHPDLPRDQALQKEARENLLHYSTTEPVAFVKMQWSKAKRMWFFYYRGGGVHYISTPMRIWQVVLVILAGAGLLAGFLRRRHPLLGAVIITIAFSTLIHTIVVSQARYNIPLMPSLIAGGVAGWFFALQRRPKASEAETATMPAWNSEESASGARSATAPAT